MDWVQLKNQDGYPFAVRVGDIDNVFVISNSLFIKIKHELASIELSGDTFDSVMEKIMRAE